LFGSSDQVRSKRRRIPDLKYEGPKEMKVFCIRCGLPENFPGVRFDENKVCNFCLDFKGDENQQKRKEEYRARFELLVKELKGRSQYDALMCYSGGKDSTHTLAILKQEYGLSVLALSFDNGFLPDQTLKNIRTVVEQLRVDHILLKPRFDILARIFHSCARDDVYPPKALERASSICTSCMGLIKYSALRLALEKNIPFVGYGWSPGQAPIASSVMKNNAQMVRLAQKALYEPMFQIGGAEIRPYFLEDSHLGGSYSFPYNVHPMAFLDYDIEGIYDSISRLGWKRPGDVDANSTNCLLNSYGNYTHKRRFGFHPYALELSNLVREGYLDRSTAMRRLDTEEDPKLIEMIKNKIELGMAHLDRLR
jgi:hypothetical protein